MIQLILAQLLVCAVQYYIATTEKIKNVLWTTFLFNFFNLVCYFINGDLTTTCIYVLICVRSFVYTYRDRIKKHKWHHLVPAAAILAQIIVSIFTIENPWQLIPVIIPCYVCYYMWYYDTTQKLRIGNIIGNGAWCVYNTVTGLYIVAVGRLITVVMNIAAYAAKKTTRDK